MKFTNVEAVHINLKRPLMVIRAPHGVLACGYLSVAALDKFDDAAAIVTGVGSFAEMLDARPAAGGISKLAAERFGIDTGMTGAEILERFGARPKADGDL